MYRQNGRRFSRGGLSFSFWTFSKLVIHTSEKFPFTGASRFCCSASSGRLLSLILLESIPVFSFTACAAGARPFLIRGKDAKAYQEEEPAVPLLGTSPPEIVCAKKEILPLCCAPVGLWIASAFALQKLIREICMTPCLHLSINLPVSSPIVRPCFEAAI